MQQHKFQVEQEYTWKRNTKDRYSVSHLFVKGEEKSLCGGVKLENMTHTHDSEPLPYERCKFCDKMRSGYPGNAKNVRFG